MSYHFLADYSSTVPPLSIHKRTKVKMFQEDLAQFCLFPSQVHLVVLTDLTKTHLWLKIPVELQTLSILRCLSKELFPAILGTSTHCAALPTASLLDSGL